MRAWIAGGALAVATVASPALADVTVFETAPDAKVPVALDLFGWVSPRLSVQQSDDRPAVQLDTSPALSVYKARLGTAARLGEVGKLVFEMELAREVAQPIDAFLVVTPLSRPVATLSLTLGQFRVPFSRQNMIQSRNWQLPDPAYWIAPKFVVDRDIGAMIGADLFKGRVRTFAGLWNGNEPGRGQPQNLDDYFLFGGRLEIAPLGPVPRYEGDLRPLRERYEPRFAFGGGVLRNRQEDKHYLRTWVGADAVVYFGGASLYGELYYRTDRAVGVPAAEAPAPITALGFQVQAGFLPPIPWVREHVEIVGRFEQFDPNQEVDQPGNDAGARELDQSNPSWGYRGIVMGANLYWDRGHDLKLGVSYELRNETKRCLDGQSGAQCTGYVDNNLFVVQATAGF